MSRSCCANEAAPAARLGCTSPLGSTHVLAASLSRNHRKVFEQTTARLSPARFSPTAPAARRRIGTTCTSITSTARSGHSVRSRLPPKQRGAKAAGSNARCNSRFVTRTHGSVLHFVIKVGHSFVMGYFVIRCCPKGFRRSLRFWTKEAVTRRVSEGECSTRFGIGSLLKHPLSLTRRVTVWNRKVRRTSVRLILG